MDMPDPFSPLLPIVHRFRQILRATPRILTELPYVGSSWVPCLRSAKNRINFNKLVDRWRSDLNDTAEVIPLFKATMGNHMLIE